MRRELAWLALGAVVAFGAVASADGAADPFEALNAERLPEVKPSATLALPGPDGKVVRLPDDFKGKVILLSFFSTT